jgi:hypothetical protein
MTPLVKRRKTIKNPKNKEFKLHLQDRKHLGPQNIPRIQRKLNHFRQTVKDMPLSFFTFPSIFITAHRCLKDRGNYFFQVADYVTKRKLQPYRKVKD